MSPGEKKDICDFLCPPMPQGMVGAPSFMSPPVTELSAITGMTAKRG